MADGRVNDISHLSRRTSTYSYVYACRHVIILYAVIRNLYMYIGGKYICTRATSLPVPCNAYLRLK